MAEYSISSANLSAIESELNSLAHNLSTLSHNIEFVSDQVQSVDNKVGMVSSEVAVLANEFRQFVQEAERVATLADAKQNVVILEQQLENEFGHYDEIRRHTVGILQASDISIVKKETISTATEELMLNAPRYWLAPALIALAAWINDEKALAERALKEAMKRDDEKTSLLFALISRRAGRYDGAMTWLERYFGMQDPTKMENRVIAVLDAFAGGLFGPDAKGLCSRKIKEWLDELSSRSGFVESQRLQWSNAILGKKVSLNDDEFNYLEEYSPTWPLLKESLSWAKTHQHILDYFKNVFETPLKNTMSIQNKIDEVLDNLVKNYDNDELPLRRELRRNKVLIEENGVKANANSRMSAELGAFEEYGDFSKHLTDASLYPERTGALITTQKLAISLSKDWIIDAYSDLTLKSRAAYPNEILIEIANWSGKTTDGGNETNLLTDISSFVDAEKLNLLSKINWLNVKTIVVLVLGGLGFVALISNILLAIIVLAGAGAYAYFEYDKAQKQKVSVAQQMDDKKKMMQDILKAVIAEVVDYRRLYAKHDSNFTNVTGFLADLSSDSFIAVNESNKVRTVL